MVPRITVTLAAVALAWPGARAAPVAIATPVRDAAVEDGPSIPPVAPADPRRLASVPVAMDAMPRPDGRWRVRFALSASDAAGATRARVAGAFTGWQGQAIAMQPDGRGGFAAACDVPPGVQPYKFILDDGRWIADPANPDRADDGNGGSNSVLRLGAHAALSASGARLGDGAIDGAGIVHEPGAARDRWMSRDGAWRVRTRTLAGDVESVRTWVRAADGAATELAMVRAGRDGPFDVWESPAIPAVPPLRYTFIFLDGSSMQRDPQTYTLAPGSNGFRTPDWAKDAVWYQVMVDRFRNGDPANDPPHAMPWGHDWYKPFGDEGKDGQTFYRHFVFGRFAGGDLQGLQERLPYLKSLGVNALYLMPMFQATTPHKYNTTNYLHVDEHFGTRGDYAPAAAKEDLLDPATWTFTPTDRRFLDFLREAKRMGFRVVIDGVFNHCGTGHPAFQDVRTKGKDSRYADWFDITSWDPFKYEAWWGFSELPVFRKDPEHGLASASVRKHVMDVTRRWMDPDGDGDPSDGVDGWRLDVPNEVPLPFWHEWCRQVRAINPDAYIVGEIWERADHWLDGRAFDAVMNYEFAKAAVAWVIDRTKKITASEFERRLAELRLAYPSECTYAMMNLLDSHDTDRVASMARNPDRTYNHLNREQEGNPYDAGKPRPEDHARQRLLALLQATYVGAPMVYYGDEVGMWGSNDPNNRRPMLWDDLPPAEDPNAVPDASMHEWYRRILALRNAQPALRRGDFRTVHLDDGRDVWAFERMLGSERVLVALNASMQDAEVELPASGEWEDLLPTAGVPAGGPAHATIPALSGRVWKAK
jgi:glycosidase